MTSEQGLLSWVSNAANCSEYMQSVLDAIPARIALLDPDGKVSVANTAWMEGDDGMCCAIGASYFDASLALAAQNSGASADVSALLGDVLAGRRKVASYVFPSHAAEPQRWFRAHFVSVLMGEIRGAAIVYLDITDSVMAEQRLFKLAHFDALTGLPNRMLFVDRLKHAEQQANRAGGKLALIFADLDHFKKVNDTLGHQAGDQVLQQFGMRLCETLRKSDTIGRLGGDEFALILPGIKDAAEAALVARKLLNALKAPFLVAGKDIFSSASLGLAIYPDDAGDTELLLGHADAAMYRAKEQGGDSFQFFTSALNENAIAQLQFDSELRQALGRGEFEVYYQPKVSCLNGEIVGAEALLRWNHPIRGVVSPTEFIPVLEEINLIEAVGAWVLNESCWQLRQWTDLGLNLPVIAVNLSARQLDRGELVAMVRATLDLHGIRPERLELELTESLLMRNVEQVIKTLAELRQMGVKLAVDDFGTGYSSLSYLKQFPLDSVKVDRAFVRDITADPDDASITRAVITMAHQLKLKVVAEGVETEGQLALLVANQCDEIQGYLFSRPVPALEMARMLTERRMLAPELIRPGNRQRTILLVDDEENILSSLRRLLRRDGYQILSATSGTEGLALLAKNPVDVIVSDQRMPGMTGVEFLRRVKTIHPTIVRIVLSGYTELQSITDAINEGAVYKFLTKPWDDELLRSNIEEAFRHKELADENRQLSHQLKIANTELAERNRQLQELLKTKQQRIVRDETMLGVVQEVLHQVPIPIVGFDNEGMIVFANDEAHVELGKAVPLLGNYAADCLPDELLALLEHPYGEVLRWPHGGTIYRASCFSMDDHRYAQGKLLMLVPEEKGHE